MPDAITRLKTTVENARSEKGDDSTPYVPDPIWSAVSAAIEAVEGENKDLLTACRALVAQMEHAMTGLISPDGHRFVAGVTEVMLLPDHSYGLTNARAAIAKAEGRIQ